MVFTVQEVSTISCIFSDRILQPAVLLMPAASQAYWLVVELNTTVTALPGVSNTGVATVRLSPPSLLIPVSTFSFSTLSSTLMISVDG